MASTFNLTIDDASPLISYGGAWLDASASDTAGLAYNANTFHSTTAQGATATISFKGTGIEIYGGHKPTYGDYTITVDGKQIASGSASGPAVQQQLLGSAQGLQNGPHTAVLTSTGAGMDIDWASVLAEVGPAGSKTTATIVDDANSAMTFAGNWSTASTSAYVNNTIHFSDTQGSAASLQFFGTGIAIFSTVSPNHANVQVSIDGETTLVQTQSSLMTAMHPQTLLYYTDNLEPAQHVLILTNPGATDGTGAFVDLDAVVVYNQGATAAGDTAPKANTISNQANLSGSSQSGAKTGVVVGAAIGVIIAVLAMLGLFFFLWRRRNAQRNRYHDSPATPVLAMQQKAQFSPDAPTPIQPLHGAFTKRASGHSIAPSYYAFGSQTNSFGSGKQRPPMPMSQVPKLGMPIVPQRTASTRGPGIPRAPP